MHNQFLRLFTQHPDYLAEKIKKTEQTICPAFCKRFNVIFEKLFHLVHRDDKVDYFDGIAPFVVIPSHEFYKIGIQ